MRGTFLLLAFALAIPVGAAASSRWAQPLIPPPAPPPIPVAFTPYANGAVKADPAPPNLIYLARTRRQTRLWATWLSHAQYQALQQNDFRHRSILGVFLLDRSGSKVTVTDLGLEGDTLQISLEVVPPPVYVCNPPPGGACPFLLLPRQPGSTPYTLVAISKEAVAEVRQVVVTKEVDDPPEVINVAAPPPSQP